MKKSLMQYIVCPETGEALKLTVFEEDKTEIIEGLLTAKGGRVYPIIRGVPRLLPQDLLLELVVPEYPDFFRKHKKIIEKSTKSSRYTGDLKKATSHSFGFEWTVFSKMFPEYRDNFLQYIAPVTSKFFKGKVVLDAGCGVGRHTYYAAEFGSKAAIGMDLSEAVVAAHENCKKFKNCHIVQGDIYHPPFKKNFDYVFSIGVLHHLPHPQDAFNTLVGFVKKKGLMSIWVYGRNHNAFARFVYEPMRVVTTKISHKTLYKLCHAPAVIMQGANLVTSALKKVGLKKASEMIPFSYYERFQYEVKLNDCFDVFATPKSRYYKIGEIRRWFKEQNLKDIKMIFLRKNSIKGFGIKQ